MYDISDIGTIIAYSKTAPGKKHFACDLQPRIRHHCLMSPEAQQWADEHAKTLTVAKILDGKEVIQSPPQKNRFRMWIAILTIGVIANLLGFLSYIPFPRIEKDAGILVAEKPIPTTQFPNIADASTPRIFKTYPNIPHTIIFKTDQKTEIHTRIKVRANKATVNGKDVSAP
jgi:hypothetical protein